MQQKVQAEGDKDEDLFEKFMCFCKNNDGKLEKTIEAGNEKIEQLSSAIEEQSGAHAQVQKELEQHKSDRSEAKDAIAKATSIREKEAADFASESGEAKANIAAIGRAIPAIEKGVGSAFLQTRDAKSLSAIVESSNMDRMDIQQVQAFLQGSSEYAPQSGEILGILKQMKEGMEKDLAELVEAENGQISNFESLMAAKKKEISVASKAIEEKTARIGNAAVELVNMKNDLRETKATVEEDSEFLRTLKTDCKTRQGEFDERKKLRAEELVALADTVKILNDDDALDLFNKAAPKASFLQVGVSAMQLKRDAAQILRDAARSHPHAFQLNFIALAMRGSKVGFEKLTGMIDNMVDVLKKEQAGDEETKEYCRTEFDKTGDHIKDLKRGLTSLSTGISEGKDAMAQLQQEIKDLKAGVADLDAAVASATANRKTENEQFTKESADNNAAVQLLEIAKNRLNKFYNPKLYKPPPPQEMSEEDRVYAAMGGEVTTTPAGGIAGTGVVALMQIRRSRPEAPETGSYKKSGQSTGVISMIDTLINDIKMEAQASEIEEKQSQKDYQELMDDSTKKRAADSKAITEKAGALAGAEEEVQKASDERKNTLGEFDATQKVLANLHSECDWLLENFDARKTARGEEIESLTKAKAVLSGADYSFLQKGVFLSRRQ